MGDVSALCAGLFDDASMFSPNAEHVTDAFATFCRHQFSWYADAVASLMCQRSRVPQLERLATERGMNRLSVSVVIPEGPHNAAAALSAASTDRVEISSVDVRLDNTALPRAVRSLAPLVAQSRIVYLEMDVAAVNEVAVHLLADAGLGLKLSLGATSLYWFTAEDQLARALVTCAGEGLPVKCAGGLHRAVRHRDTDSLLHHHGYLNVALAARVAASTGNAKATAGVLSITDPSAIVNRVQQLSPRDVTAIRRVVTRIGSFHIAESINDLRGLGLLAAS
jgi:hypothetical protein